MTYLSIGKALWAAVVAVATLLSYAVLKPNISIEPYSSQDPHTPFAEQFFVQNNSLYTIKNVEPSCIPDSVSEGNTIFDGIALVQPTETIPALGQGAKTNATCNLDQFFKTPYEYGNLMIDISVSYQLPFSISRCKDSRFRGKPVSDGTVIWTYEGSPDCLKLK